MNKVTDRPIGYVVNNIRKIEKIIKLYGIKCIPIILKRLRKLINEDAKDYIRIKWFKTKRYENGVQTSYNSSEEIIVSMTSYPERFGTLPLCLKSILRQSLKPNRIILYLDDTVRTSELTEELTSLTDYGLEIVFRPENIRPHKKYYYAIKENPDAVVITVDDDVIYDSRLLENLIKTHYEFPNCVVAARAHKILFEDGIILPYRKWEKCCNDIFTPAHNYLATGVGGVLYPSHVFDGTPLFDLKMIKELALTADDLWLKVNEIMARIPVVICDQKCLRRQIELKCYRDACLCALNVGQKQNDVVMKKLVEQFSLTEEDFEPALTGENF